MMVDGLVSIIMPSWNTERFIAETIQSVIDQTYTNYRSYCYCCIWVCIYCVKQKCDTRFNTSN